MDNGRFQTLRPPHEQPNRMIRELIDAEPAHKPLSDANLTRILNDKGIPLARRTVAKYRQVLNIPALHERVRLDERHGLTAP